MNIKVIEQDLMQLWEGFSVSPKEVFLVADFGTVTFRRDGIYVDGSLISEEQRVLLRRKFPTLAEVLKI